jgi:hypothetical protein
LISVTGKKFGVLVTKPYFSIREMRVLDTKEKISRTSEEQRGRVRSETAHKEILGNLNHLSRSNRFSSTPTHLFILMGRHISVSKVFGCGPERPRFDSQRGHSLPRPDLPWNPLLVNRQLFLSPAALYSVLHTIYIPGLTSFPPLMGTFLLKYHEDNYDMEDMEDNYLTVKL